MEKYKKITLALIALLFAFTFAASAQVQNEAKYIGLANTFLTQMKNGEYDKINLGLTDSLKKELSITELKNNMEYMFKTKGKILKQKEVIVKDMPPYKITITPLAFEKEALELRLAFDHEFKIAGIFFTIIEDRNPNPKK